MTKKAIFFDRDGTLILDKHYQYESSQIEYFPDTFSALQKIQKLDFLIFIVTNQSGINRGIFTLLQMQEFHDKMIQDFQGHGIAIQEIAHCPHMPEENCLCRKPHPQLINQLCEKYNVNKAQSIMIGDKLIDAQCGINAGILGVTIFNKFEDYKQFNNLEDFANFLISNCTT
jgi:D-glycero-D-manno-heptose 1,7-bisphosphate phosphatase